MKKLGAIAFLFCFILIGFGHIVYAEDMSMGEIEPVPMVSYLQAETAADNKEFQQTPKEWGWLGNRLHDARFTEIEQTYSLVNILLLVNAFILSWVSLLGLVFGGKTHQNPIGNGWSMAVLITGVISVISFFAVNKSNLNMVIVDKWTPLFFMFFMVQWTFVILPFSISSHLLTDDEDICNEFFEDFTDEW